MKVNSTTQELCLARIVTDARIEAAVDAYMAEPTVTRFPLADGYCLDLTEAVEANRYAARALADPRASDSVKRMVVRSAILLARPAKA